MEETRVGSIVSSQIGRMGSVSYTDGVFRLPNNTPFNIKNDGDEPVELEVQLDKMADGSTITTMFEPGWNPEIVKAILGGDVTNIKWGY
jgi:hypothetical protein